MSSTIPHEMFVSHILAQRRLPNPWVGRMDQQDIIELTRGNANPFDSSLAFVPRIDRQGHHAMGGSTLTRHKEPSTRGLNVMWTLGSQ